ncbi:MAG: DUF2515 domain-containing protein, partial [Tuberibacillus sp.]
MNNPLAKDDVQLLDTLKEVKKALKKKSKKPVHLNKHDSLKWEEKRLVASIEEKTRRLNKNNVTRTEAYFQFYQKHPEIHWAFLGHMVSRNGGWNMTDLKGEWMSKLLTEMEQAAFFSFLERGNWLIFQDIYPQFLLYEESKMRHKNLFHLLPYLGVSSFMEIMWTYFWGKRDPYPLAIALIINEQNYLEKRVIQNNRFKKAVLNTVGFKLYDFLRFNHILFPYYHGEDVSLVGETSTHFTSLQQRIILGKKLYNQLFGDKEVTDGALRWARDHPHSGSRKDYWPHLFNNTRETHPRAIYKRRIKDCQLVEGSDRIYSPSLQYAWSDVKHPEAEDGDWFDDWHVMEYILGHEVQAGHDIEAEYCKTLEKIELAV